MAQRVGSKIFRNAAATMPEAANKFASGNAVPDVLVSHGYDETFKFLSHPGVMAVQKLLEQRHVVKVRANFTPKQLIA